MFAQESNIQKSEFIRETQAEIQTAILSMEFSCAQSGLKEAFNRLQFIKI